MESGFLTRMFERGGEVPQASREVFMPWRKAAQSPRDVQFGRITGLILKGYIVLLAAVVW
ncbi:hypothetical protein C5167_009387 [Papaver somniferum]|uniref:Uncharacterized protein n=1 Tax=Papaver somniferum TaxID=3469 RepID=A0A4Y7JX86_PAPSO|nr:hypothetical protein C5167_009387 [Papaver somniferum]